MANMKGTIANVQKGYDNWNLMLGDQSKANTAAFTPFTTAGVSALDRLNNPNENFMTSPDYAFRQTEAAKQIGQNKAAQGLLSSGSFVTALQDRGQQIAADEFGDWWNRQAGLAGMGLGATGNLAALNTANTNQMGQNAVQKYTTTAQLKGQAQASTNSLWGSVLGIGAAALTGGGLGGLMGAVGGAGGSALGAASTGMGGAGVGGMLDGAMGAVRSNQWMLS